MKQYVYKTTGVCSREIRFNMENGVVSEIKFDGGCPGNLQAISKLLEGKEATEIVALLKGNQCGRRGTSCADQLTVALERALARERENAAQA